MVQAKMSVSANSDIYIQPTWGQRLHKKATLDSQVRSFRKNFLLEGVSILSRVLDRVSFVEVDFSCENELINVHLSCIRL